MDVGTNEEVITGEDSEVVIEVVVFEVDQVKEDMEEEMGRCS